MLSNLTEVIKLGRGGGRQEAPIPLYCKAWALKHGARPRPSTLLSCKRTLQAGVVFRLSLWIPS